MIHFLPLMTHGDPPLQALHRLTIYRQNLSSGISYRGPDLGHKFHNACCNYDTHIRSGHYYRSFQRNASHEAWRSAATSSPQVNHLWIPGVWNV